MPLRIGQTAPDFTLSDQNGLPFHLNEAVRTQPVLLFFYPADFTPVCTKQACMVRDQFADLRDAGLTVVGISSQSGSSHARFHKQHSLPYRLLCDPGRKVAASYGATLLGLLPLRVTFLIDETRTIVYRVNANFSVDAHRQLIDRVADRLVESAEAR